MDTPFIKCRCGAKRTRERISVIRCGFLLIRNGMFVVSILTFSTFATLLPSQFLVLRPSPLLSSLAISPSPPNYKTLIHPTSKCSYSPYRPAVVAPWMGALKLPVLIERRLHRVWRHHRRDSTSIKCPPLVKSPFKVLRPRLLLICSCDDVSQKRGLILYVRSILVVRTYV